MVTLSDVYCCDNCEHDLITSAGLVQDVEAMRYVLAPNTQVTRLTAVDTDAMPQDAGMCENCWAPWITHIGWRCQTTKSDRTKYSELREIDRYKTSTTEIPKDIEKVETVDWRQWRDHGKAADECPCGSRWGALNKEPKPGECVYHRR